MQQTASAGQPTPPSNTGERERVARGLSGALFALAIVGLVYCAWWAVGPRAADLGSHCGSVVSTYLHPRATDPQLDLDFVDPARICNADAVHLMHKIYVFASISLCLVVAGLIVPRRLLRN